MPPELPNYTLEELTPEEQASLTKEMNDLLEKYNCDMSVTSRIELLKRVPIVPTPETNGTEPQQQEETTEILQADSSD